MSSFTLGIIDPLSVRLGTYEGPNYADHVSSVPLLGDGSSDDKNEALQSGALGRRRFPLAGRLRSKLDVDTLRDYHAVSTQVSFTDPYTDPYTETTVIVESLRITQIAYFGGDDGLWDYSLTLAEV